MKKVIYIILLFTFISTEIYSQQASNYTIQLARMFSKDLFESNGLFYLDPVVRVINATSNSRFYNSAYVPSKVKKPYFKVSLQGMVGFVNDDYKYYNPHMPTEKFEATELFKYADIDSVGQRIKSIDTAGLIRYIFLNMMYDGIYGKHKGAIKIPDKASTALGTGDSKFVMPNDTLKMLLRSHDLYTNPLIPQSFKDSIENYLTQFPDVFTLYGGANLNTVIAAIPQFEIGSLFGTELLVRFIPSVRIDEVIGDFGFWGIGLKHSISQYFNKINDVDYQNEEIKQRYPHDVSVQLVYQSTNLKNKVGVTKADLNANADILNANINYSYYVNKHFNIFAGIAYQSVDITSIYEYKLPIEIQRQLGMIEQGKEEPTPGFPGDLNPQKSEIKVNDSSIKGTIGVTGSIGFFDFIVDYNISKFNILGIGLQFRF